MSAMSLQPREAKALLFHSDYKNHDQNDVLQWQRHERFSLCLDPYPCETTLIRLGTGRIPVEACSPPDCHIRIHFLLCLGTSYGRKPVFERETSHCKALRKLEKLDKLQMSNLRFGVTGKELCYFLVFSSRICGGNILCQGSSALSELVANGLVIVETFNHNHKSIGMIKEPMIERFLLERATRRDAHAACDQFIAERMNTATGSNFGNEAEYSVANQILAFSGHSLRSLLTKWGCVAADKRIPEGFYVLAQRSAALNDLGTESTELLGDGSPLRVTRPRDRIILPECHLSN
ncbi:hypothetical protein QOT17_023635 [Balamuthia mandrillaris]